MGGRMSLRESKFREPAERGRRDPLHGCKGRGGPTVAELQPTNQKPETRNQKDHQRTSHAVVSTRTVTSIRCGLALPKVATRVNQSDDVLPLSAIAAAGDGRARLQKKYRRIAPWYDILDLPLEVGRYRKMRAAVFDRLSDAKRLLDCGAGTGRNANHYPPYASVVAFDLSAEMITRARSRLSSSTPIVQADAVRLPFASHTFDAAAATFLFCVLPEELQVEAIHEICRVLKVGGRLVLLEYVLSRRPLRRAWMKMWSPWVELAYGASFTRNTSEHLRRAGVEIEQRRFLYADAIEMIVATPPRF